MGLGINIPSSLYSGKTPLGHDFGHLYTSERWKKQIEDPLSKFAEKIYREPFDSGRRRSLTNSGQLPTFAKHLPYPVRMEKTLS